MDCLIDLDPTHRVLRATVTTRALTDEGLMDLYRLIERIATQGGPYSAIIDLSEVLAMRVSASTVETLAESNPAVPEGTPRVIVAKKDVVFGLSRMFELNRDSMHGQLHVVHSLDEAYVLLGVNSENFSKRLFPQRSAA
jgi:hypothetical protein